jgi:hypothetical protein
VIQGIGAVPTGFKLVAPNVPIIARFAWDSMPNAVSYSLRRAVGTDAPVERLSIRQSAKKSAQDIIPDPRATYRYTLVVTYADGGANTSPTLEFVSPPVKNPTGFTVKDKGEGNVEFLWTALDGAVQYRLDGPGFPDSGTVVPYGMVIPKIPAGANTWKLTALYEGNFADYANPATATAVIRVLPAHTVPWLSKNNGVGSEPTLQMPRRMQEKINGTFTFGGMCQDPKYMPGILDTSRRGDINYRTAWLGTIGFYCPNINVETYGLQAWLNIPNMPLWGKPAQYANEAVYGNDIDLGVGRRTQCAQGPMTVPPYAITTTCYATAHGPVPGAPGFNEFKTITRPGEGVGTDFILAMVISKDPSGSTFLVILRDPNTQGPGYGNLADRVSLDTEGRKYVPHVCLSCHGGKFNEKTLKVDGASFLPLDPGLLAFASPADKAAQQENMRKVNAIVVASAPQSAVAAYIRGLYGNAVSIPGTLAKDDYVPQGWSQQPGFYRTLVKPYCASCHLAAPESWNFASWENFEQNKFLIKGSVCNAHTMPHSELQYKAFWTKDTGPVYLPGLLASTLNWPGKTPGAPASCP